MFVLAIVALMLAAGCGQKGGEEAGEKDFGELSEIAQGQELYVRNGCPLCHGDQGRGDGRIAAALNPQPRDFRDLAAYQQGDSLEAIAATLKKGVTSGRSVMPAYPHLSLEHRRLIAGYIVALQADSSGESLSIKNPWIRESLPPHSQGAAYLTIKNQGPVEDVLTRVEARGAGGVEIHLSYQEGEMMKMKKMEQMVIPGRGNVELRPGGVHLMLVDLEDPLEAGEEVELTLHFKNAGLWPLVVPVRPVE